MRPLHHPWEVVLSLMVNYKIPCNLEDKIRLQNQGGMVRGYARSLSGADFLVGQLYARVTFKVLDHLQEKGSYPITKWKKQVSEIKRKETSAS